MRYSAEYLFPSLLHIIETDVDEQIKPYCLNVRQKDPVGNVLTNMGGWQSQSIYEDTLITDSLYKVFKHRNHFTSELKIINHWININGPGSWNALHEHPQCDLAGVFYIDVPENSGQIMFENLPYRNQNIQKFIKPVKGLILLFPAHARHAVLPNESNEDRISVSFNINLTSVHPSGDA